jgi:hypothetical protein
MPAPRRYPQELRERAVRLVLEARVQGQLIDLIGYGRGVNALTRSLYDINQRRIAA